MGSALRPDEGVFLVDTGSTLMRVIGVNTLFIMWGFLLLSSAKTSSCWSPERRGIYKEIYIDILTQWSPTVVVVNPFNDLPVADLCHIIGNHFFHGFFFISCNSLTEFFFFKWKFFVYIYFQNTILYTCLCNFIGLDL